MLLFDTDLARQRLEKGMSEEAAGAVLEALRLIEEGAKTELATKEDIRILKRDIRIQMFILGVTIISALSAIVAVALRGG